MKVLFGYRYGILGGVCTQLLNRLRGFAEQGDVEVHFAFKRDHGISDALGTYPHVLYAKEPKQLASYCKRHDIDVISVIDTPEMLEVVQVLARKRTVVLEVHTTYAEGLRYLEAGAPAHAVLVPSAYSEGLVRDRIQAQLPVHRVGNCVDPDAFQPLATGAAPPSPVVLWVGKLDDHKNWRGFLEIAAALRVRSPEVAFWMVGGKTAPDELKRAFASEIDRLGLRSALRWFESIPYAEMPSVYQQVARSGGVAVSTSHDESFGMSAAEAILCGCRVVASEVGALPELDHGNGAISFYRSGDLPGAVERIALALQDGVPRSDDMSRRHAALAQITSPFTACAAFRSVIDNLRPS